MLVLTRRTDEALVIADDIVVTVLAIEGDRVKLGIQAPQRVTVLRQELCEAVRSQNLAAARFAPPPGAAAEGGDLRQTLETLRKLMTAPAVPAPADR